MTDEQDQTARGRFLALGWRSAAIAGGAAFIGILTLVAIGDRAPPASRYAIKESGAAPVAVTGDPLRAALTRCRTLPANSDDAGCRAAWEESRRRFMGESRSFVAPVEAIPATMPIAPSTDIQAAER